MAYFHTTVLDNQIKALPTVDTASGSIATFDTDMTENLIEVKCQIVAQQSGSGTPSPSNPRPITVYTSLNLSHSGADTSNPTVYNIPFGQTVAQGVLNVGTGKLRVTWGAVVDMGSLSWSRYNPDDTNIPVFYTNVSGLKPSTPNALCDIYSVLPYFQPLNNRTDKTLTIHPSISYIYIADTDYTSATDFENSVNGHTFIYELATPIEIQLDSTQIIALLNENNIWCDTGDTSVKFLLTVGKAIS